MSERCCANCKFALPAHEAPEGMVVDHKKAPTLNNHRENLRICTQAQNRYNTRHYGHKSPYKGVFPEGDKWGHRSSTRA